MSTPVWIDTDMGADDLFAILLVLRHRTVAGVSLTFGCAQHAQVIANAAGAAQTFGWDFPLTAGAARPILGPVETAARILGPEGYLTRGARLPKASASPASALPALAAHIARGGEVLALGPLTTLATLALAQPDLAWPTITWMGGSLGPGNHTPAAEYNALADPEALAILLDRGIRIRMIDLEACRKVTIDGADVDAQPPGLLRDLLGGYLDIALTRGRARMALYDPVAAAALVRPDLFDLRPCHLTVTLDSGPRRGQTCAINTAAPNAQVAHDLNAPALRDICLSALRTAL
jgi:purine nucleosidase